MKKKVLIAVLAIVLLVGLVSAAVLTYYGKITGTVTVGQAVKLDGLSVPDSLGITETKSGVAGLILGDMHNLVNYADEKIMVNLVSTGISAPSGDFSGFTVYPEYRLNAMVDDDALFWVLSDPIVWSDFGGLSFDYYIASGPLEWIPQCNLVLRDGDGVAKYYASWHSFRTGINGTIGVRESITYVKDLFYFYELPSWALLGLWTDLDSTLQTEINLYQFEYFTMQAGDTSTDPNTGPWEQIVWLSEFATDPTKDIIGIALPTSAYDPALRIVEFRMMYNFAPDIYPGEYVVKTDVIPLGFWP